MTSPGNPDPQRLSIEAGWLVYDAGRHTCGTGPEGHYGAHEPGCGLEPLMSVEELSELFDVLAEQGTPINRPRLAIAAAERRGREEALRPFEELFAGGPDTVCRTVYRTGTVEYGIECVEVPLDELRAAFETARPTAEPDETAEEPT